MSRSWPQQSQEEVREQRASKSKTGGRDCHDAVSKHGKGAVCSSRSGEPSGMDERGSSPFRRDFLAMSRHRKVYSVAAHGDGRTADGSHLPPANNDRGFPVYMFSTYRSATECEGHQCKTMRRSSAVHGNLCMRYHATSAPSEGTGIVSTYHRLAPDARGIFRQPAMVPICKAAAASAKSESSLY